MNKNHHLIKHSVDYAWAKFLQASKMSKRLIEIFFSNPYLALMQKQLSYKNMDKIRTLLIELPYSKITW